MPELLSQLNESQWANDGPQTPAQRHFAKYKETVDSYGFMEGSGSEFYAKDVLFHNQNNAEVSCFLLFSVRFLFIPGNVLVEIVETFLADKLAS